ncbi:MAG: hypothetical protein JXR45_09405 [Deltaproteobacteria bacterium]|nr:hypothetical protein [Deltaproteobacteria bacterium]
MEQKDALQQLSSLKHTTATLEDDLNRVRQTQTEIEIDLARISQIEGPATVHQIGDNYFCRKRKHQMLSAVIKERQKLEKLYTQHLEKLNSMKDLLANATRRLNRLADK